MNDLGRVSAIVPRFKAAGIRSVVDTARDAWILGESIVRDLSATKGPGLEVNTTRLRDPYADRLVSMGATF